MLSTILIFIESRWDMTKQGYTKAICENDRLGLEKGITLSKEYYILDKTNRYITLKNDYGVVTRYWKGLFKLE